MADQFRQRKTIYKVVRYVRKYWAGLIAALLLSLVYVAMSLYIPILVGRAIDHIIVKAFTVEHNIGFHDVFAFFAIHYEQMVKRVYYPPINIKRAYRFCVIQICLAPLFYTFLKQK